MCWWIGSDCRTNWPYVWVYRRWIASPGSGQQFYKLPFDFNGLLFMQKQFYKLLFDDDWLLLLGKVYICVWVPQMLDYCQLLRSNSLLLKNCTCYCASMCQAEIKMRLWFDVWRLLGLASWIFITSLNYPCIPGPGRVAPLLQLPSALTFSDQSEQSLSSGPSERVVTLEESMRQLERGIQSGTLCFHFEVFNTQTGATQKRGVSWNKFEIINSLF